VTAWLSYDYAGQRVWLDDPGIDLGGHHSALCAAHAGRLRVPQGWSCQDRRIFRLAAVGVGVSRSAPLPEGGRSAAGDTADPVPPSQDPVPPPQGPDPTRQDPVSMPRDLVPSGQDPVPPGGESTTAEMAPMADPVRRPEGGGSVAAGTDETVRPLEDGGSATAGAAEPAPAGKETAAGQAVSAESQAPLDAIAV
jgi:hypothetical protein